MGRRTALLGRAADFVFGVPLTLTGMYLLWVLIDDGFAHGDWPVLLAIGLAPLLCGARLIFRRPVNPPNPPS